MERKLESRSALTAITLIAIGAALLFGVQHRFLVKLRESNVQLRQEIASLERLKSDSALEAEPNQEGQDSLTDEELLELLRLRAEVVRLRPK